MRNKTESIVIVYPSGCYGHWIHWCIQYFGFNRDLPSPLIASGASHGVPFSKLAIGIDAYRDYLNSEEHHDVIGVHPIVHKDDNLCEILREVSDTAKKVVFLTPDQHSLMLAWNNKWTKVRPGMYIPVDIDKNISMWGKSNWTDMDLWMKREFLSFWWWKARLAEHNWSSVYKKNAKWDSYPEHVGFPMMTITLSSLRDACKDTVLSILDYLELPLQRPIAELESMCDMWGDSQKHFVKDKLINEIIHSTVNGVDFNWADTTLTLIDEATIQMELRDLHKLDLKCYNLNVLPTNTIELRKLLTNV